MEEHCRRGLRSNSYIFISAASLGAPCPMPDPSSYCLNGGTCLYFETVQEQACK